MIGYRIISIGNDPSEDYIGEEIYLSHDKAENTCKKLQFEIDYNEPDNPYLFKVKPVEIIQ